MQNPMQGVDLATLPAVYSGSLEGLEHRIVYYETTRGARSAALTAFLCHGPVRVSNGSRKQELRRLAEATANKSDL